MRRPSRRDFAVGAASAVLGGPLSIVSSTNSISQTVIEIMVNCSPQTIKGNNTGEIGAFITSVSTNPYVLAAKAGLEIFGAIANMKAQEALRAEIGNLSNQISLLSAKVDMILKELAEFRKEVKLDTLNIQLAAIRARQETIFRTLLDYRDKQLDGTAQAIIRNAANQAMETAGEVRVWEKYRLPSYAAYGSALGVYRVAAKAMGGMMDQSLAEAERKTIANLTESFEVFKSIDDQLSAAVDSHLANIASVSGKTIDFYGIAMAVVGSWEKGGYECKRVPYDPKIKDSYIQFKNVPFLMGIQTGLRNSGGGDFFVRCNEDLNGLDLPSKVPQRNDARTHRFAISALLRGIEFSKS